jgi:membrane protease YdiL (CAAX protease family)
MASHQTSLKKSLLIYFLGIAILYIVAWVAFWPKPGAQKPSEAIFMVIMFAPTFGAILAKLFAKGSIQFGRPNKWLLAGFVPTIIVLGAYLLGSKIGVDTLDSGVLVQALSVSLISIFLAGLTAIGEEIGWRGFMWPAIREKWSYGRASLFTFGVWWAYHVPLILLGWYGSVSGLLAFTVAIAGFTLFVGAITDRAKSIWPSVVAHGAWNALVATSFAVTTGEVKLPAFSGSSSLMGEFGWLAAISMLVIGVNTYFWHMAYLKKTA